MYHTNRRVLSFKENEFNDIEHFKSSSEQILSEPSDQTYQVAVTRAYNRLYKHHQIITVEDRLISRMQRKSQIRDTLFRVLTTLSIGLSVMFVYRVA